MFIPFQITDWEKVPGVLHAGEKGQAIWKTLQFEGVRIRMVEYSADYLADHWCTKGHIIYCVEGEMITHLADGSQQILKSGMTYQVTDEASSHKSQSDNGVKLLIIDGDFLKP